MAISMGGDGEDTPLSDINTTPLVDVMLVLLIIFLIAVPVAIQTVKMELPVQQFEPTETKAANVLLAVSSTDAAGLSPGDEGYAGASPNGDCRIYWNITPMDSGELVTRATKHMEDEIEKLGGAELLQTRDIDIDDLPEAHLRGDINTPYKCIGGAITAMQRSGFFKIGFISSPIVLTSN